MPRGDIWRPPVSFRGGGVSVPTGHTGPAPVPVHGSILFLGGFPIFLWVFYFLVWCVFGSRFAIPPKFVCFLGSRGS